MLSILVLATLSGCDGDPPPLEPVVPVCDRGIVGEREVSFELAQEVRAAHSELWWADAELDVVWSGLSRCGSEWYIDLGVDELTSEIEARFAEPVDGVRVIVEEGDPVVPYERQVFRTRPVHTGANPGFPNF